MDLTYIGLLHFTHNLSPYQV